MISNIQKNNKICENKIELQYDYLNFLFNLTSAHPDTFVASNHVLNPILKSHE
jgi:hypothetical protein